MSSLALKNIQTKSLNEAHVLLENGVATIGQWQGLLESEFGMTVADVSTAISNDASLLTKNEALITKLSTVRSILSTAITNLTTLETYIHLSMPQMEDGNNFGVTVQMTVLKSIADYKEKLEKKVEELVGYFSKRAEAVEKLGLVTTTETETTTSTSTLSTGGKDGDEDKNSTTTTRENKSTQSKQPEFHRVQNIYALDVHYYGLLQQTLSTTISAYVTILDNILKNQTKLEMPKGSSGGGSNFSSMY